MRMSREKVTCKWKHWWLHEKVYDLASWPVRSCTHSHLVVSEVSYYIYIYTWYIYIHRIYLYIYIHINYILYILYFIYIILYMYYIYIYIHIIVFRKSCSRSLRFWCVSPLDMFALTMDWSDQKMERSKQDRVITNWAVANQRWLVFVSLWHVSLEPCSFRRHVQWLSCPTVKWWLCCVVPSLAHSIRSEDWNLSQLC